MKSIIYFKKLLIIDFCIKLIIAITARTIFNKLDIYIVKFLGIISVIISIFAFLYCLILYIKKRMSEKKITLFYLIHFNISVIFSIIILYNIIVNFDSLTMICLVGLALFLIFHYIMTNILKVNKNFLLIKNNINEKNRIKEFSKNEQIIIFLSSIWLYITPSIFFIFSLLFNNSYLCIVICSILSIIISVFILQNTIIRMIQHKPKIINISGVAIANLISFILVLISSQVFDNSYLLKLYFIIIISYYFIVYAIIEN